MSICAACTGSRAAEPLRSAEELAGGKAGRGEGAEGGFVATAESSIWEVMLTGGSVTCKDGQGKVVFVRLERRLPSFAVPALGAIAPGIQ